MIIIFLIDVAYVCRLEIWQDDGLNLQKWSDRYPPNRYTQWLIQTDIRLTYTLKGVLRKISALQEHSEAYSDRYPPHGYTRRRIQTDIRPTGTLRDVFRQISAPQVH